MESLSPETKELIDWCAPIIDDPPLPPKTTSLAGKVPPHKRYIAIKKRSFNDTYESYYIDECFTNPQVVEYLYGLLGKHKHDCSDPYYIGSAPVKIYYTDLVNLNERQGYITYNQMYLSLFLRGTIKISFIHLGHNGPTERVLSEADCNHLLRQLVTLFMEYMTTLNAPLPKLSFNAAGTWPNIYTDDDSFQVLYHSAREYELPRFYSITTTLHIASNK